jgi:hypothetical protein
MSAEKIISFCKISDSRIQLSHPFVTTLAYRFSKLVIGDEIRNLNSLKLDRAKVIPCVFPPQ